MVNKIFIGVLSLILLSNISSTAASAAANEPVAVNTPVSGAFLEKLTKESWEELTNKVTNELTIVTENYIENLPNNPTGSGLNDQELSVLVQNVFTQNNFMEFFDYKTAILSPGLYVIKSDEHREENQANLDYYITGSNGALSCTSKITLVDNTDFSVKNVTNNTVTNVTSNSLTCSSIKSLGLTLADVETKNTADTIRNKALTELDGGINKNVTAKTLAKIINELSNTAKKPSKKFLNNNGIFETKSFTVESFKKNSYKITHRNALTISFTSSCTFELKGKTLKETAPSCKQLSLLEASDLLYDYYSFIEVPKERNNWDSVTKKLVNDLNEVTAPFATKYPKVKPYYVVERLIDELNIVLTNNNFTEFTTEAVTRDEMFFWGDDIESSFYPALKPGFSWARAGSTFYIYSLINGMSCAATIEEVRSNPETPQDVFFEIYEPDSLCAGSNAFAQAGSFGYTDEILNNIKEDSNENILSNKKRTRLHIAEYINSIYEDTGYGTDQDFSEFKVKPSKKFLNGNGSFETKFFTVQPVSDNYYKILVRVPLSYYFKFECETLVNSENLTADKPTVCKQTS